jgi:hypothetical protein
MRRLGASFSRVIRNESCRLFFVAIKLFEQTAEFGADASELFVVQGGKPFQSFFAPAGELNQDLPAVFNGRLAHHQFLRDQPVYQAHHAVMAKLQSFGQFADGDLVAPGKTLDGQQCLMSLGRDAGGLGRRFTEMEEPPKRVTKRRKCFILRLLEFFWLGHDGRI